MSSPRFGPRDAGDVASKIEDRILVSFQKPLTVNGHFVHFALVQIPPISVVEQNEQLVWSALEVMEVIWAASAFWMPRGPGPEGGGEERAAPGGRRLPLGRGTGDVGLALERLRKLHRRGRPVGRSGS